MVNEALTLEYSVLRNNDSLTKSTDKREERSGFESNNVYRQTVCQSRGNAQYRASDNKNEYNFHIIAPAPVVPISFRE